MFKLFLFAAFLAIAAAAPGAVLAPLSYSAPAVYSSIHAAAYPAYSTYSAPLSYGYSAIPYAYKAPYIAY